MGRLRGDSAAPSEPGNAAITGATAGVGPHGSGRRGSPACKQRAFEGRVAAGAIPGLPVRGGRA